MIHMSRNVELFNLCSIRIGILGRAVQDNEAYLLSKWVFWCFAFVKTAIAQGADGLKFKILPEPNGTGVQTTCTQI